MEGGKVLYFYLRENERFKRNRWSRGKLSVVTMDMGKAGELGCCGVPEWYRRGRVWEADRLREEMGRALKDWGAEEFYLQPGLASLAEMEEEFPPEALLEKTLAQVPCMEYLVYIGENREKGGAWEDEALREERRMLFRLLTPYLARINHFILVTDRPEGYEEFTDYIYEEYGIPTATAKGMDRPFGRDGRTVILDRRKKGGEMRQAIPQRASYLDLWSEDEKRKWIEKERTDIRYISVVKFLDTLVKNGYNTIVNQTVYQKMEKNPRRNGFAFRR